VYTTTTICPLTNTITTGKSTSLEVTETVSTIFETVTSTICTKCYGPPSVVPVPGVPQLPVARATSTAVASPAGSNPGEPSPLGNTQAGVGIVPGAPGSPTSYAIVTMTVVPAPVGYSTDTYVPSPSQSPIDSAPYPVGNGTSPNSPTGTSASPSEASTGSVGGPTLDAFTGAASKMGAGGMGGLVLAVMATLML
jgi:hypothetical protein